MSATATTSDYAAFVPEDYAVSGTYNLEIPYLPESPERFAVTLSVGLMDDVTDFQVGDDDLMGYAKERLLQVVPDMVDLLDKGNAAWLRLFNMAVPDEQERIYHDAVNALVTAFPLKAVEASGGFVKEFSNPFFPTICKVIGIIKLYRAAYRQVKGKGKVSTCKRYR